MLISTQVEVVDEHMILLFKNRLSQLSLGQSHYLSGWVGGWVVDKTKIMQCYLLTEVVVEVEDELGNRVKEDWKWQTENSFNYKRRKNKTSGPEDIRRWKW